jgi:hypothetical protein
MTKPLRRMFIALRLPAAACAMALLAGCSMSVQWEEEVPLNSGETIWVKRTDSYVRRSEPGNPLQMGWWINQRGYEFSWQGRQYAYQTDARASLGALLIHVLAAEKTLAIVDSTRRCAKPGYGEFRWAEGAWQLQKEMSPALIGRPRNLMGHYSSEPGAIPTRVTSDIRQREDTFPRRGGDMTLVATKAASNCNG